VALYALHGLLHLLGMRDDTPEGRAAMAAAQGEIFHALGLAGPAGQEDGA
jgi:ssRNA-specific RNase YbeY (16S rRNA maturation enzyme)